MRPASGEVTAVIVRVVETAVWWLVLAGVWTLTLPAVAPAELTVAVAASLPAAAAATAVRRAERAAWRPSPSWARWALAWPAAVVADTGRVLAAAFARHEGGFTEVTLPDEDGGRRAARRAFAALTLASTPGTVVVDVSRRIELHRLGGAARTRLERRVTR